MHSSALFGDTQLAFGGMILIPFPLVHYEYPSNAERLWMLYIVHDCHPLHFILYRCARLDYILKP